MGPRIIVVAATLSLLSFQASAEPKITGLFGVVIGEDIFNNSTVGGRKIIDVGEQALAWQFRVDPIHGFPDLDNYYVRYNPRDRTIYHAFGESHVIPRGQCPAFLQTAIDQLRAAYPQHPYDWDGVSTFIIGPVGSPGTELEFAL